VSAFFGCCRGNSIRNEVHLWEFSSKNSGGDWFGLALLSAVGDHVGGNHSQISISNNIIENATRENTSD